MDQVIGLLLFQGNTCGGSELEDSATCEVEKKVSTFNSDMFLDSVSLLSFPDPAWYKAGMHNNHWQRRLW